VHRVDAIARAVPGEQLLDQALGADQLPGVDEQDGEQGALAFAAERERLAVAPRGDRAEDRELHRRHRLCPHRRRLSTRPPGLATQF
jgi:hypothetical protein